MQGAPEAQNEAQEWLHDFLTDGGGSAPRSEIRKHAAKEGISNSAVDRAKVKLKIKSKTEGFGENRKATWYLPEAWPDEDD